ncbi:MAG: sugar transferase [Planctomycetota bacterium]
MLTPALSCHRLDRPTTTPRTAPPPHPHRTHPQPPGSPSMTIPAPPTSRPDPSAAATLPPLQLPPATLSHRAEPTNDAQRSSDRVPAPRCLSRRLADRKQLRIKRTLDLLLVLLSTPLTLPLLALTAAAVACTSRGPVLYRHRRLGLHGQPFHLLKFRTMRPDADQLLAQHLDAHPGDWDHWQATHKLPNDPRLTRVGRWLRRLSLDELPQLLNVLRGEMSLVGPRPIVDDELTCYGREAAVLHRVRPGLTGLWQVSGRHNLTFRRRVALDAAYVRDWSVRLDLAILARTARALITARGSC